MNEREEFSHIKVTPAEEEDVVIQAGAVARDDAAFEAESDAGYAEEAVEEVVVDNIPVASPEEGHSQSASQVAAESSRKSEKDDYKATTLDDIERSKMSTTQKAIIVIAILAVVAFIVYSILFN